MSPLPRLTQTDLHLTDQQLVDLLEAAECIDPHLTACSECQSELAGLRASIATFRVAAINLADAEMPPLALCQTDPVPRSHFRRPIWAASLATAAVLLTISVSLFRPHHVNVVAPAAEPEITVSDEALLDGIQDDLSTSIPPSLEPLAVPTATPESH